MIDLTPLRGMPLEILAISGTFVSDLSPIRGMPLVSLEIGGTLTRDLSPLKGMQLNYIEFAPWNIKSGIDVILQMKTINKIGFSWPDEKQFSPEEFWKKYDAGEFVKPR